jgi:choline dehydrogenase-like flavoprotein
MPRRVVRLLSGAFVIYVFLYFVSLNHTGSSEPRANTISTTANVPKHSANETLAEYDFIIAGGGQSGLVVANRLSESGKHTVLVVEYGHLYHDDPLIARPWRPYNASAGEFHDPKLMYNYSSVPQVALNNRRTPVSAAATVGGGSTVNGMFLNRGSKEDYDAWEELGNPGWGWSGLLPYFRRSVTYTPPGEWLQTEYGVTYDEEAAYGGEGSIHVSNPAWAWPGQKVQIAGWKELGIKQTKEGAGGDAYGVFWVPRAQDPKSQTRSYSVTGHLDSAMSRSNMHLLTGHRVRNVLLDQNDLAYGVVVKARNGTEELVIRARKEVILAAGLHSPLILQRSGIGRRDMLEKAGVPCQVHLPGVGMNMQDHPAAGIAFEYKTNLALNPSNLTENATFAAEKELEFNTLSTGPLAGGHNAVAFLTAFDLAFAASSLDMLEKQSHSDNVTLEHLPKVYSNYPQLLAGFKEQRNLLGRALASRKSTQVELPIAGDSYALHILQKPLARGSVELDPQNPLDGAPLVDFQTLANPVDMEIMVQAMKLTRVWAQTDAMSVLTPVEQWPGTAAWEAAEKREKIKNIERKWRAKAAQKNGIDVTEPYDLEESDNNDVAPPVDQGVEDERLRIHIRNNAESSIGHESGTCAMLPLELGGVVGPDLLVHKVKGISVVDSSIIPLIPSTNLCATVYAVAEKAADLIKERHSAINQKPATELKHRNFLL